jgi:hypothetical protein
MRRRRVNLIVSMPQLGVMVLSIGLATASLRDLAGMQLGAFLVRAITVLKLSMTAGSGTHISRKSDLGLK